jgi:hypothetical protein
MKNLFAFTTLIFTSSLILFSCSEENQQEVIRSQKAIELHGEWVNKRFIADVEKSRSVFATTKNDYNMIYMGIDSVRLNAKVGTFKVWDDQDGNYSTVMAYDYKKEQFVNDTKKSSEILPNGKTPYTLNVNKSGDLEIDFKGKGKETYVSNLNFNSLLCDVLFDGTYKNKATGAKVEISINAMAQGLPFDSFKIAFDFTSFYKLDFIIAKTAAGVETRYMYWFTGKELHLQQFVMYSDAGIEKIGAEIVLEKVG